MNKKQLVAQNKAIFRQLASQGTHLNSRVAWLGKLNTDGSINPNVSDGLDMGYVWIRFDADGEPIRASNMSVSARIANTPVWVGQSRSTSQWEVLRVADNALQDMADIAGTLNTPDRVSDFIQEVTDVNWLKPLRCRPGTSAFDVYVEPGYYIYNGAWVAWEGGTINISSSVPTGNTKRPVLIGIDPTTNTLTSFDGDPLLITTPPLKRKMVTPAVIAATLNAAPTGIQWLACIPLTAYETTWLDLFRVTALQFSGDALGVGLKTFLALEDTPDDYTGFGEYLLAVKADESAVEFVDSAGYLNNGKVKGSSNDTTPNYLVEKVTAGNGITISEVNDGGDEDVSFTVNEGQLSLANLGTRSIDDLSDVALSGLATGQFLKYAPPNWVNSAINLDDLGDVTITSVASNHALYWNGSAWVNGDVYVLNTGDGMTGGLSIDPTAAGTIPLTLVGGTANIAEFQSSGGATVVSVSAIGNTVIAPSATTGSVGTAFRVTGAAHTDVSNAELTDVHLSSDRTVNFLGGATIATNRTVRIDRPIFSADAALTITNASTVEIQGSPTTTGGNVTLTNSYALRVIGGNSYFGGQFQVDNLMVFADTRNIQFSTGTGTKIGTGTTQKIGFWNATPVVQSTGWSVTNPVTRKSFDTTSVTLQQLAEVVGTIIDTDKSYGLRGA